MAALWIPRKRLRSIEPDTPRYRILDTGQPYLGPGPVTFSAMKAVRDAAAQSTNSTGPALTSPSHQSSESRPAEVAF